MGNIGGKLSKKEVNELKEKVKMSEEQIQHEYNNFKRTCKQGRKLTKKEFIDLYQEMFEGDAKEFAENIFRSFDKDRNGTIEFQEYLIGLKLIAGNEIDEKLKWAFSIYDLNEDGTIDKDEMLAIIKAVYRLHDLLNADDKSNEAMMRQLSDDIFLKMDTNKDGLISLDEFATGAKSDKRILRMLQGDMFETGGQQT